MLHGKAGGGKTQLITRWLIPGLQAAGEREGTVVFYGACRPVLPDVLEGRHGPERFDDVVKRPSIIIVDDFENVLDLPRDDRRAALDHLFERLQSVDARAHAVLVTDTRQLTSVYALTSYDPGIAGAVLEIPSVGLAEGLQELSFQEPETAVTYSQPALLALGEDGALLERQGWDVTFDLIRMVDAQCRELRQGRRASG